MKVLWITNILFPETVKLLTGKGELKSSGGWMLGAADALLEYCDDIQLTVAAPSRMVKSLTFIKGERINYYILPRNPKQYESYWKEVKEKVNPDIVHIHGTEFPHGLAYVIACGEEHVVVSIQGLVSVIANYYLHGMNTWEVICKITIGDILRRKTLFSECRDFRRRGQNEEEMIRSVNHIIGRTSWDKAHVWAINPNATYYSCNETLRKEFYSGVWSYEKCRPHTIFLSQASYPIKGLHQLLKAMPLVLRSYPNSQIRIAGGDITAKSNLFLWLKQSGYGNYISRLIHKLHIENHVTFLGPLNADKMKAEYLSTNVFVCPSSIENSPNSLGEAQILGVPCIAAYVGGVPDMMFGAKKNLYRFEEIEMLADKICSIFDKSSALDNSPIREIATDRHNREKNARKLMDIYKTVVNTNQ